MLQVLPRDRKARIFLRNSRDENERKAFRMAAGSIRSGEIEVSKLVRLSMAGKLPWPLLRDMPGGTALSECLETSKPRTVPIAKLVPRT